MSENLTLNNQEARRQATLLARASYGRLVALLSARSNDVARAEDALSHAFEMALKHWPENGVPHNPEAWLMTAAKRHLTDGWRHQKVHDNAQQDLIMLENYKSDNDPSDLYPDQRLKLLFACTHPAIDSNIHTPLMLQTTLGLTAEDIGRLYLVAPSTIGQRLSRAKTKIRDARIPFEIPEAQLLPERVMAVLDAVYAVYGLGWDEIVLPENNAHNVDEAVYLAKLLTELLPEEPECLGLLALILFTHARQQARRGANGEYVPLSEQNTELWDKALINEANAALEVAASFKKPGCYQLDAALQQAMIRGAVSGEMRWDFILALHQHRCSISPTAGAWIDFAAALINAEKPENALAIIDAIEGYENYQPLWAVRGHALNALNKKVEAKVAFEKAIALADDPAVKAWLATKRDQL